MKGRRRMRLTLAMLVLAAGTFTDAGFVYAGGKKEQAEMADAAKVTIEQAAKSAAEKAGGKVIEAELEKKHGKVIWEVKTVDADGKVTDTHIDAESGAVIESRGKK